MKEIYLLAAMTLALVACDNNDDDPVTSQETVKISATIGESLPSRVSDNKWSQGDEIGVTAIGNVDWKFINYKYTAQNEEGDFSGDPIYFHNPMTIKSYYPFTGEKGNAPGIIEANTKVGNQTAEDQPKIDFLYASMENITTNPKKINLAFSHQMSKLTFIFNDGNGIDVSKIVSYQIDGLILEGTFDTETGICTAKSGIAPESLVISTTDVKNEVALPSLIIFPQDNVTLTLKIKDNENQEYACNLSFRDNDNRILTGNNYQWTITVNKTGLTVNKSTIIDWNKEELTGGAESDLSDLSPEP